MKNPSHARAKLATAGGLLLVGALLAVDVASADGARFSDFTPLATSAGPTADEATPITFGNDAFEQRSIIDRTTQLAANTPNSGNFDMITVNETGRNKGKSLFTVFETGQAGVMRHGLATGQTDTIWNSLTPGGHRSVRRLVLDAVGHFHHG